MFAGERPADCRAVVAAESFFWEDFALFAGLTLLLLFLVAVKKSCIFVLLATFLACDLLFVVVVVSREASLLFELFITRRNGLLEREFPLPRVNL